MFSVAEVDRLPHHTRWVDSHHNFCDPGWAIAVHVVVLASESIDDCSSMACLAEHMQHSSHCSSHKIQTETQAGLRLTAHGPLAFRRQYKITPNAQMELDILERRQKSTRGNRNRSTHVFIHFPKK
jgi:hypothetical protein